MNKLASSLGNENYKMIGDLVFTLLSTGARTATKYVSDKLTIRASMKLFNGKLPPVNTRSLNIVVTIGAPNFEARQFIKDCKKARMEFPIKKIQLKFPPEKKK